MCSNTIVIEDSSELDDVVDVTGASNATVYIDSGDEHDCGQDVVITMATTKRHRFMDKDVECVRVTPSSKRTRRRHGYSSDCTIRHVSHKPSKDLEVLYVSTDRSKATPPIATDHSSSLDVSSLLRNRISSSFTSPSTTADSFPINLIPSSITELPCYSRTHSELMNMIRHPITSKKSSKKKSREKSVVVIASQLSEEKALREMSLFLTSSSAPLANNSSQLPPWWTNSSSNSTNSSDSSSTAGGGCTCSSSTANFTLVDVDLESTEASLVTQPLLNDGFKVTLLQRVLSAGLWRRYMGEVRLFLEERGEDAYLNEKLLYHCSRANKETICSEGLDARLGNHGNFGRGIYFRLIRFILSLFLITVSLFFNNCLSFFLIIVSFFFLVINQRNVIVIARHSIAVCLLVK